MDVYGDHALCCKKSGDLITRHNRVRNLIFKFADVGLLSPEMEKLGILGPTDRSRRRPGDISFKSWAPNRGLTIDVAVICPLAASHVSENEPCEVYAVRQKYDRYEAGFKDLTMTSWLWCSRRVALSMRMVSKCSSRFSDVLPSVLLCDIRVSVPEHGLALDIAFRVLLPK